ncbi:MAG: RagB/SusD family nutrient uptake outer membrane protein [Bacteroidales bacterium]|nr:RagB/SusD family nutrient uptake outer membrane protein [Bacteroidales bacterium]
MKKITLYIGLVIAGTLLLNSCGKDFLEVTPKGKSLESNYYKNESELMSGLTAAYDALGKEIENNKYSCRVGMLNSASDDCYAGGGDASDVPDWQAWSNFSVDAGIGPQGQFWDRSYKGIFRVNVLLTKIDGVPDLSASKKARITAEAKFIRAYFYFDLVRLFKNVPLILNPLGAAEMFNVTQATPEAVYAQIEQDLKDAIPDLPETVPSDELGRVTKMAATAYLGKVILFQNNESRMQEAANYFEQVNTSANYELISDFGSIFRPDNKFNKESIFEISHTSLANEYWGGYSNLSEGNVMVQMIGPRGYVGPTYKEGWGFNTITVDLVNLIKGDPRYRYTVSNIDSLQKAGVATYIPGYNNTGYFMQKYAPLIEFYSTGGGDLVLNYPYNVIEMRLADTYLMEAEALVRGGGDLNKAQHYLDLVRQRVGLASVPATLENIYKERRLELATEGHRFFDLVRTGQAASALAFKNFTAGKNEILPIPLAELANTQMVQNPNY